MSVSISTSVYYTYYYDCAMCIVVIYADSIAPRGGSRSRPVSRVLEDASSKAEAAIGKDEGRATLRLKKGEAVMEKVRQ